MSEGCGSLTKSHLNIIYAYCTTGSPGGKPNVFFKVADVKKSLKVMAKPLTKNRDVKKKVRRPMPTRQ